MGIHDGHRERIRDSFLEVGLKGKSEHQILELILTYVIPVRDVNPIAHNLIDKFGSLANVFDASVDDLITVPYITKNGATLLKLFPAVIPAYNESKYKARISLKTTHAVKEYMIPKFTTETNEVFYILCLDTHLNLLRAIRHVEGTPSSASLNLQSLVYEVLKSNASSIILAHNHLSGSLQFSAADINTTLVLKSTFENLNIRFIDHFIFSGTTCTSFSKLNI